MIETRSAAKIGNSMFRPGRPVAVLALAAVLATMMPGCVPSIRTQDRTIAENAARAASMLQSRRATAEPDRRPGADGINPALAPSASQALPVRLLEMDGIRLTSAQPLGLPGILARLSGIAGVPMLILVGPDGQAVAAAPATGNPTGELSAAGPGARIKPDYRGRLSGILDSIAAGYGMDWEFDGTSVLFRQYTTRRYQIAALPTRAEYSGSIGSTSLTGSIDLPGEIEGAIRSVAGPDAMIAYGRSSGHVMVTARRHNQRQVAEYVSGLNGFLARQVAFDVNVLTITLAKSASAGVDIDVLAGREDGDAVRWLGTHALTGSTGTVNVGVLSGDVDLDILVGMLDRRGRVSVETRTGATTSNNRMVPIQVVSEIAYARRVEAAAGPEGTIRTTIEPGTLTTGFELNLLPRMLNDHDILLSFSIRLSDLNNLVEFTSDRQTIQLPRVSTTSFEQQAILGNNQTLVLMGFERDRTSHERSDSGVLSPLFGARSGSAVDRISTVFMIRPRILKPLPTSNPGRNTAGRADGS